MLPPRRRPPALLPPFRFPKILVPLSTHRPPPTAKPPSRPPRMARVPSRMPMFTLSLVSSHRPLLLTNSNSRTLLPFRLHDASHFLLTPPPTPPASPLPPLHPPSLLSLSSANLVVLTYFFVLYHPLMGVKSIVPIPTPPLLHPHLV